MGRLLGIVDWVGTDDVNGSLRRLADAVPDIARQPETLAVEGTRDTALAVHPGVGGYHSGVSTVAEGSGIVGYCGYLPGINGVFAKHGLPGDIGVEEGLFALYSRHAESFLEVVPGMSMIALYDAAKRRMLVASDRNGLFPVYVTELHDRMLFSSSLGSLKRALPSISLNTEAITEHFLFDSIYGEGTFYADIRILGYGKYIAIDLETRRVTHKHYFRYESLFDIERYHSNRGIDAPSELTERLRSASARALEGRPAGEFGLLCGGGIDCSFIGSLLKDANGGLPFFCSSVTDMKVSEEGMVSDVTDRLGVGLNVARITRQDYYPLLLNAILTFDQPIVHPNFPKFVASIRMAREKNRLMQIMGAGSDLLFGSSNVASLFRYERMSKLLAFIPAPIRKRMTYIFDDRRALDLRLRARNTFRALSLVGVGNFERAATQQSIANALSSIEDPSERRIKVLMIENLCDYQQHLLNRRHEVAVRSGVSLNFPFLDGDVVSFAVNLPVSHCVTWKGAKRIVRDAARPHLGSYLAAREKWGGDVPVEKWITPLSFLLAGGFVEEALGFDHHLLGPEVEHHPKLLWNIIDIELWGRLCVLEENPGKLIESIRSRGIETLPYDGD
jgi:asparagine synthase (glutamine-hydrolysing)